MKKYVSRTKNRWSLTLLIAFGILCIIGYLCQSSILMIGSLPLLLVSIILMFSANRCPYCGEYFRGLYWAEPNAGYCRKCGKIIEFDDCDEEMEQ